MIDPTESARRERLVQINEHSSSREALEARYGQVWSTEELRSEFTVEGFLAPYVVVRRKSDWQLGSMEFQHEPRLYFNFVPDRN